MPPRSTDCNDGSSSPPTIARARGLRKTESKVERKLWWIVRDRRLAGYKFRRQFPIGEYSADFCCFEKRLIVEVDGVQHENTAEEDLKREEFLRAAGFRIIRFWAKDIFRNQKRVLDQIYNFLRA
ncbi:MAG: endonuclease domain-containing protein [Candidatus Binataceae bacterium]